MTEKMNPETLVQELNECYSAFDDIIEKNGMEKIMTIGDVYMAACGVPIRDDDHAEKMGSK